MSRQMAESLDPAAVVSWFWSTYPFTLGSYASAKVGQYPRCWRWPRNPLSVGACNLQGSIRAATFLASCGGVQNGNRAAKALIKTLALHK
jgi:hypothetical protein